ncbi:MAG TPA: ABC transporter substrate-binding protein [Polyangiaceae bacterium]|jgi:NitT/TauT family transport system substrate-binding protein|nr:ABC transporter substrate-binding protein [Polyangiaceae bacterium]
MRRRLALALLAAVPLVALGCKGGSKPAPQGSAAASDAATVTRVKVQLNWVPEPEFGGLYAAREGGAYTRAGLDVDIVGGGPGSPVVQLVASGQADFAVAGADDVVLARSRGADLVAVFGTFQTSPQGIMVHAGKNLGSLADLKSGTLALEPGLPFGMYLKKKFGFAGAKLVPYDGGIAKFLADPTYAQQCYVTSEPLAVKKKGETPQVFLGADAGFNPYTNILVTRGAMLKEKLPLVRAFVAATAEGWRAYLNDPAPANAVMQRLNTAMDAETFAAAAAAQRPLIETAETAKAGLGVMTEARWSTLASQLADLGVVAKALPASEYFTVVVAP